MKETEIKKLFKKYLHGQCTPEETKAIIDFLKQPEKKDVLPEIEETVSSLDFKELEDTTSERIIDRVLLQSRKNIKNNKKVNSKLYLAIAASITGLLFFAAIAFYIFQSPENLIYTTSNGEQKEILLPDKSVVLLKSNSTLSIDPNWKKKREVVLHGEATFDVAKSKALFVVYANSLMVEVYGTQFSVNSTQNKTSVLLNSGSVKIKLKDNEIVNRIKMRPGDLIEYSDGKKLVKQNQRNSQNFISWEKNQLIFENTSLKEIFEMMEDDYGYLVTINDKEILRKRFTGSTPNSDMNILFDKLEKLFGIKIQKDKQIITVK